MIVTGHLLAKAAGMLISGIAGAVVVDRLKQPGNGNIARRGAVTVIAWGLKGKRRVETGAENVRLSAGDLVAEARERVGEQAPPPADPVDRHDHEH
jgi:hypothetical protein